MHPKTDTSLQTFPINANNVASSPSEALSTLHEALPKPSGDLETNLGALREFLTMLFNTFYLSASMIEPFVSSKGKKTPLGYSLFSTISGLTISFIIAACSAKTQHDIDKLNETTVEYTFENVKSASTNRENIPATNLSYFEWLYKKSMDYFTDSGKLTSLQALQLAVAKLGQAGDLIGFAVGILNSPHSSLNKTVQTILTYLIFSGGVIASEAAIRPSRLALIFSNKDSNGNPKAKNVRQGTGDPNENADKWTIIFILAKIIQTSIANINFYGSLFDKIMGNEPNTPFGVSSDGIKYGVLPIVYVTFSVVLFQYLVSVMNQAHYRKHATKNTTPEMQHSADNERHTNPLHAFINAGKDDIEQPRHSNKNITAHDQKDQEYHPPQMDENGPLSPPLTSGQETEAEPSISILEKSTILTFLTGRMLGTATDCSVPLLFALNNMISSYFYFGIAIGGTTIGARLSTSDWRTNKQNWDAYRKKNAESIDNVVLSIQKNTSRFTSNVSTLFSCVCPSTPSSIDSNHLLSNDHAHVSRRLSDGV